MSCGIGFVGHTCVPQNDAWSRILPDGVLSVATDGEGVLYALTAASQQMKLAQFADSGAQLWSRELDAVRVGWSSRIVANDRGVWALIDGCGDDGCTSSLVRFDLDGTTLWSHPLAERVEAVALHQDGWVVVVNSDIKHKNQALTRLDSEGNVVWHEPLSGAVSVAIDSDGNVLVGGQFPDLAEQNGPLAGKGSPRRPFIAKFDGSFSLIWSQTIPTLYGVVTSLDTSVLGTVVAALSFSTGGMFSWAGTTYETTSGPDHESGVFLAAVEPNGAERWGVMTWSRYSAQVDVLPDGQMAVLFRGWCGVLARYNAAGDLLWLRQTNDDVCRGSGETVAPATSVAILRDMFVVGGGFANTHDFGEGPRTAQEDGAGFLRAFVQ
jgi:hypothetical protein